MQMSTKCSRCDAVIDDTALDGFCARCLLADLLAPNYAAEAEGATPPRDLRVLRYFGDYEFVEELSRGGMGTVFKAHQVSLNRFVAVKIIEGRGGLGSKSSQKRFRVEAEAAARLQHPNIVPIYEFGEYGGEYFLSMKLIENARSVVELRRSPRQVVSLLIKIAQAIHYAHQHGVLHRDIKPGNILVGADDVPYLTDFGLAKLTDGSANLTRTRETLGTPAYMAPEQVRGSAQSLTTAVDIYGFGATLYECLTGQPPFEADSVPELLRKILEEEPAPILQRSASNQGLDDQDRIAASSIDRDLETICLKCLDKDADRRYASAAALAEDLDLWRQGKPIAARPVTTFERIGKWARRKPASAALLVTAALAMTTIVIGGSWFNWRLGQKNDQIVEQVIRLNIDAGSRLETASDSGRAMLYFAEALRLAEANNKRDEIEMLRLRFHSLLGAAPRLMHFWTHEGGANTAVFSPDGTEILSAGNDRTVRLWDVHTGEPVLAPLQHESVVLDAFFSPDGRVIASLDADARVHLWDSTTGLPLVEPLLTSLTSTLKRFGRRPLAFDLPTGFFACGRSNIVRIVNLKSRATRALHTSGGSINHLAFRPGSDELAVASDAAIEIWNSSGSGQKRALSQSQRVRWIEFSPDGGRLLLLFGNGTARIIDPESGDIQAELRNPSSSAIFDIHFSPDGHRVITGNFANTIRVWDAATGSQLCAFDAPAPSDLIQCGQNGNLTAVANLDGSVQFWDHRGTRIAPILWHGGSVSAIGLDPSGHALVAASQDGSVRLWGLAPFEAPKNELDLWQQPSICTVSPDKQLILASSRINALQWFQSTGKAHLGSVETPDPVIVAKWSPDSAMMAAISWAPWRVARLSVWNRKGALQFQLPHRQDERSGIHCFEFSPDGSRLAIGFSRYDHTGGAQLIDPKTGDALLAAVNHAGPVRSVDFDPEGRRIVTASDDRTARVWDARTGQPLSPPLQHESALKVARFSPDGQSLLTACADDTFLPRYAQVWNAHDFSPRTGRLLHRDGVLGAVFSPDSQKVATGGEDGIVTIWDALTGKPLFSMQQPNKVDSVAFSSDGRFLLVSCRNSSLRVVHVATGEVVTDVSYGGSTAVADFSPANDAIFFAGIHGKPVVIPLASSTLPVDRLRQTAELLSNHKLNRIGFERLSLERISSMWRSEKSAGHRR